MLFISYWALIHKVNSVISMHVPEHTIYTRLVTLTGFRHLRDPLKCISLQAIHFPVGKRELYVKTILCELKSKAKGHRSGLTGV